MTELFKMSNKTYDRLKWIAAIGLPTLNALVTALLEIWHVPYAAQISASMAAVNAAVGAWVGVSHLQYKAIQPE